jgi:single-strand selective monofunctional uracil DNA glycosylase
MPQPPLIAASRRLSREVGQLRFSPPVRFIYNPLLYAQEPAELYLQRYGSGRKSVVLLGMNPGPWGMAQTGVPFGEVSLVRDWLGIEGKVMAPVTPTHPRVPVRGFDCPRSEVSGSRLWGLIRDLFGDARAYARSWLVANYCPLLFLDGNGRNITPDRIPAHNRAALYAVCDRFLETVLQVTRPGWLVGVGTFARQRAAAVLAGLPDRRLAARIGIATIPHPSPASPQANRGWAALARTALRDQGIWVGGTGRRFRRRAGIDVVGHGSDGLT